MRERLSTTTVFTMSATSQATAAFGAQTYRLRIATFAQPAFFTIGDGTPTAAATSAQMPANWVDSFDVTPGQKCAVLQGGTAGTISVSEMT